MFWNAAQRYCGSDLWVDTRGLSLRFNQWLSRSVKIAAKVMAGSSFSSCKFAVAARPRNL